MELDQSVCPSAEDCYRRSAEEASRICEITNDGIAEFCNKYPSRFAGLAAISLADVDNALNELDRAVRDLGFRGVIVATNQNGKGLDSEEYLPFFSKLSTFDVPVLLHLTNWGSYPLVDTRMMTIFGWPFDTTQAVWRLITGGILDSFPALKVVTHHLGAMLPYFSRKVNSYAASPKRQNFSEYWKQIYGDTAIDGAFDALLCGYAFSGSDRVIFGTDYPFGSESGEAFIRNNLTSVTQMPIPQEEKEKVLSGNAKRILRLS